MVNAQPLTNVVHNAYKSLEGREENKYVRQKPEHSGS